MTTYSSVSMDFGGLKKNSPMIFQNDERSPMDFKGRNVCSSPDDEKFGEVNAVKSMVSAVLSCDLLQIYHKFATHNT